MQRFLFACAVGLGLLVGAFGPTPATAHYYRHHHHHGYHHHHHGYHHHHHRYRYGY